MNNLRTLHRDDNHVPTKHYVAISLLCAFFCVSILSLLWEHAVAFSESKPTSIKSHELASKYLPTSDA